MAQLLSVAPMNPREIVRHFKTHPPANAASKHQYLHVAMAYGKAHAGWIAEVAELKNEVSTVEHGGEAASGLIVLKPGEVQIAVVTGASLIE